MGLVLSTAFVLVFSLQKYCSVTIYYTGQLARPVTVDLAVRNL